MDILESLSTLQIICQLCSLTQWQYERSCQILRRSYLLEIYTVIVLIGSAIFLLYGIFCNDRHLIKNDDTDIGDTVDFIQMIGIRISHIVCLAESLIQRQVQRQFYEKVRQIDKIFECSLNVDVNNRKFRRKTLQRASIMFGIYITAELLILATKLIATREHRFPLYWIFYLMPLLVCGLRYFQIYTAINIIKRRFDKLIKVLTLLNMKTPPTPRTLSLANSRNETPSSQIASSSPLDNPLGENSMPTQIVAVTSSNPRSTQMTTLYNSKFAMKQIPTIRNGGAFFRQRNAVAQTELCRLLVVRDLYNQMWELTALLNRSFGISILINVGNDFISITSNCYWTFLNFKQFIATTKYILQIACSAVWSVPHLFNILVLAIICERTQHCTTRMALSLHSINIDIENDNHNSVIEQFSLQLLHQKLAFTAAGFFNVDCTLLYTIVGATTTYLIILIQFHMNETTAAGGG